MKSEIWRDVVGFESQYAVSNRGRVRSKIRKCLTKYGSFRTVPARILQGDTYGRYHLVTLCKGNGRAKTTGIHRLVARAFIANPKNKPDVNHKDGNPKNNDVLNLEWVTLLENFAHARRNGLTAKGHLNGKTSSGIKRALRISRLLKKGNTPKQIAVSENIDVKIVLAIRRGKTFRSHLQ